MKIDTNTMVSITEANQNFSKVAVEQLFTVAKKTRSQQIIFFKCRLLKHKTSDT
jgi:hypothetical protein